MKYIKAYEKIQTKYNVDDLVKLNDIWNLYPYVKITSIHKYSDLTTHYYISTFNDKDEEYILEVDGKWLTRKLTPEEIKTREIKIASKKYNL
jgi:hypothetical protein